MTDQDRIPRFADGEPIGKLNSSTVREKLRKLRVRHPWLHAVEILGVWAVVIGTLAAMFWLLFLLVSEKHAHAQEVPTVEESPRNPSVIIFEKSDECFIDIELHVVGKKRAACVDRLDTATRLARAEMQVNERRRKR